MHSTLVANVKQERGVALMSVMLFMILLAGMSLVLLSVILAQMGPSFVAQKSTKTVYAAQAGIQAALGVIRSAAGTPVGGQVFGDRTKLPCTFSGNLDGSTGVVKYNVTIQYYLLDPTGKTEPWLSNNDLTCSPPPTGVSAPPKFAYIVSQGAGDSAAGRSASEGNRSVAAIYKFKVTNVNIPGGRVFDPGHTKCMQAESATTNALIKFIPIAECTTNPLQLWIYDSNYQIRLASTTVPGVTPLCITGAGPDPARLQNCLAPTDLARWDQLWSWNDNAMWEGQKQDIPAGKSGRCLQMGNGAGSPLNVEGCARSMDPSPAVGAGAAGFATHQIVNFKEFGRCADVTDKQIGKTFMIVYPCKQDATGTGANMNWNHKWYYDEPAIGTASKNGLIYVMAEDTAKNCLKPAGTPPSTNREVIFSPCGTTGSSDQYWTRFGDSPDQLKSYTIRDQFNRCLTTDLVGAYGSWSIMRVAACDGTAEQKWNAPPTLTEAQLDGFKELG
jgi:hypothetical protein